MSGSREDVNELLAESLSGRTSRRDILKRAAALGLSAPLVGVLMSAHGASAQDATPAGTAEVGSWITQPANLRTDLAGMKITAVLGASGSGTAFTQALCAKFAEYSGCEVNLVEGPESATDRLNIAYLPVLSAQGDGIDVLMIDVIWPGILAEHAVDLSAVMAENGTGYFDRIVQNNTVDGVLVGIPWYTDAGLLYYRKDLLEKYGFAAPPATWTELETQAAAIMEGEKAAGMADFYGFVYQAAAYEGLTCNAIEWQISQGGGNVVEPDGTVSLNNEAAAAAFDRAKGWIGTIAPEGVTTYKEEESRGVWQAGNAAFMRNWPYAFSLGQADDSPIKDKFDVTLIPMGEGEGAQNADCLGGWQIMVSKYSKSQEAALEFAKFLTSPEVQKAQAVEKSLLPTIAAVYDDADVLAANPFFASLKPIFQGGAVPRPSTVTGAYYDDVSTSYFTAVSQILTGQQGSADALAAAAEEIQAIMDEKAAG
jgi:trehalose/maltose transport system substrate-binding protein